MLPSGKPASLELGGPPALRRAGGGARGTEERYELAGPARAVITGLTLRPRDEAGTRLAFSQLELKVAGKAIAGAEHAAWLADGTLPAEKLRFPDKVGEPAELRFEVR